MHNVPKWSETHFKNLAANAVRFFKVCLTILGYYALRVNTFFQVRWFNLSKILTTCLKNLFRKIKGKWCFYSFK